MLKDLTLSERLETVASLIPSGTTLADIGSDHAYLPCFAYQQGIIDQGIAGEVNDGPFQSAQKTVRSYGYENYIDVRKGNGLEVLAKNEVETIVVAGMGGSLIRTILSEGYEKLEHGPSLILQPNNNEAALRQWLTEAGYEIYSERMIEEDGHIYEIMASQYVGTVTPLTQREKMFGPFLLHQQTSAFQKKWRSEYEKRKRVLASLQKAKDPEQTKQKQKEMVEQINLIKEVLDG